MAQALVLWPLARAEMRTRSLPEPVSRDDESRPMASAYPRRLNAAAMSTRSLPEPVSSWESRRRRRDGVVVLPRALASAQVVAERRGSCLPCPMPGHSSSACGGVQVNAVVAEPDRGSCRAWPRRWCFGRWRERRCGRGVAGAGIEDDESRPMASFRGGWQRPDVNAALPEPVRAGSQRRQAAMVLWCCRR